MFVVNNWKPIEQTRGCYIYLYKQLPTCLPVRKTMLRFSRYWKFIRFNLTLAGQKKKKKNWAVFWRRFSRVITLEPCRYSIYIYIYSSTVPTQWNTWTEFNNKKKKKKGIKVKQKKEPGCDNIKGESQSVGKS